MQSSLDKLFKKIIRLLTANDFEYLIIGGLAVGVIGEPRMTQDIDLILFISCENVPRFLRLTKAAGFKFSEKDVLDDIQTKGAIKLSLEKMWIDIILASTEFEKSALARRKRIKLMGEYANFPSPEDLIILKLIPGREKDILDAKSIVERHKDGLERKYLEQWAQRLCDEAEDMRIWNLLKKIT